MRTSRFTGQRCHGEMSWLECLRKTYQWHREPAPLTCLHRAHGNTSISEKKTKPHRIHDIHVYVWVYLYLLMYLQKNQNNTYSWIHHSHAPIRYVWDQWTPSVYHLKILTNLWSIHHGKLTAVEPQVIEVWKQIKCSLFNLGDFWGSFFLMCMDVPIDFGPEIQWFHFEALFQVPPAHPTQDFQFEWIWGPFMNKKRGKLLHQGMFFFP